MSRLNDESASQQRFEQGISWPVLQWLLICQLLNLSSLVAEMSLLYLSFAGIVVLLQWQNFARYFSVTTMQRNRASRLGVGKLAKWLLILIALTGCLLIAVFGRQMGLLLSMVHLLCFAYSLKLFEIDNKKDIYQLVMLGCFISCSALIFLQSIYFSAWVIICLFANFLVLMHLYVQQQHLWWQVKLLVKLFGISVPLAILLFLVFPKISPFWQMPSVNSAKVGLSEQVQIGDISRLVLSDELAFRVTFSQPPENPQQSYWRALVLDFFDGQRWRHQSNRQQQIRRHLYPSYNVEQDENVTILGPEIAYQVIAEPSFQPWLFALDLATSENANIAQAYDYTLFYKGLITKTFSYQVSSYPRAQRAITLSEAQFSRNTQIYPNINPKLVALGQQLQQQFSQPQQRIDYVLQQFNQQNYRYTLQAPLLNQQHRLDSFYFQTQAGFCEHYAASFTYLMRAAGIPARLVAGYLGAEYNPNADYYSVYQRDAHAWSEVWLADIGWVRVDPTAAVAPERVERGFSNDLLQEYQQLSGDIFTRNQLAEVYWLNLLRQQIEAIDYQWTRWVVGYSAAKQSQLKQQLQRFFSSMKYLAVFAVIVLAVMFVVLLWRTFISRRQYQHQWQKCYFESLALLAHLNMVKPTAMTAQGFSKQVTKKYPEIASQFTALSTDFSDISYQSNTSTTHDAKSQLARIREKEQRMAVYYRQIKAYVWRYRIKRLVGL